MQTSYKQILNISVPIMLGSAAQNVIALSDSVFLFHRSEADFAAIGFVSVFYLIVAAIGFGFSRGGQILIARRFGARNDTGVRKSFYALCYFELLLSLVMFAFMQYGCSWFFNLFVSSESIYTKSLEYISYRSWGVFFSYLGVAVIALYTGIAHTKFIIVDTIILAIVNIFLNYLFIFGNMGFPEMGISGAGLASTISEIIAFVIFLVYMFVDPHIRKYKIFQLPKVDFSSFTVLFKLGSPMVAQSIVGLGSWFIFFGIIENLGEKELAITNLVRIVYLILSIPCWGFSAGINTMVSYFIGRQKRMAVLPITVKTAWISLVSTLIISIPVILFPEQILYPILGSSENNLITEAKPILFILLGILICFSVGAIFYNGLTGTGATLYGLRIQAIASLLYIIYIYIVVNVMHKGLEWAWASEIIYWIGMYIVSLLYLRSEKWQKMPI